MKKLDPIEEGSKIFENIFKDFSSDLIIDLLELEKLLNRVIVETDGWVIADFLDGGNWDCLGSYRIDKENNFVFLNWHRYIDEPNLENYIKKEVYRVDLESVMVKFKDCRLGKFNGLPFIAIRGYAVKDKDAMKYLKKHNVKADLIKDLTKNFYSVFQIDNEKYSGECYCLKSPVYSFLIIPKDYDSTSHLSQNILFLCNYIDCIYRLNKIRPSLKYDLSEDDLFSKGNSIRRIFENILKIECSYHGEANEKYWFESDSSDFKFSQDYSDLVLGDLFKILKKTKSEDEKTELNGIIRNLNDLSHDSGKAIHLIDVSSVLDKVTKYVTDLSYMLTFRL